MSPSSPCNDSGRLEPPRAINPLNPISPGHIPVDSHPPHPLPLSLLAQKLLGKLCEQNKVLREQERLVQQLRAEKVHGGTSGGHAGTWGWHLCGEEVTSPREGLG